MSFWLFYTFYSLEKLLEKDEDVYYQFLTNDVDIFRIIRPELFYKTDVFKNFVYLKAPVLDSPYQ